MVPTMPLRLLYITNAKSEYKRDIYTGLYSAGPPFDVVHSVCRTELMLWSCS